MGLTAVALQEPAATAFAQTDRVHTAAAGGVVEHHDRWPGAAVAAVIRHDGLEPAGLRPPAPGFQHRRPGFVHEDTVRALQPLAQVRDDRPEREAGAADPVAERRPVERDPLPPADPGLAVERKMVSGLRDHDLGDQRLGGQAAGDDMLGRMGLHHGTRAAAAGVSRAPGDQHAELRRHDVRTLGHVLADLRHLAAAARARDGLGRDHPPDPGQGAWAGGRGSSSVHVPCRPSPPSGRAAPSPGPPRARPGRPSRLRAAG